VRGEEGFEDYWFYKEPGGDGRICGEVKKAVTYWVVIDGRTLDNYAELPQAVARVQKECSKKGRHE
jgi:hypothetical protein